MFSPEAGPSRHSPSATHDHVHGSRVVYRGEQESAARGDLYLLTVDVTMCKVTPVIPHRVVSPESSHSGLGGEEGRARVVEGLALSDHVELFLHRPVWTQG